MNTKNMPIPEKVDFTDDDSHIWEVDAHEGKIRFRIYKINPDRKTAELLSWVRLPLHLGDKIKADIQSAIDEAHRQISMKANKA